MTQDNRGRRIGRPERDDVIALLREAYSKEYITQAECDERITAVLAARTQPELNATVADLPDLATVVVTARTPGGVRKFLRSTGKGVGALPQSPFFWLAGMLAGALTAIVPPIMISAGHPHLTGIQAGLNALFIITGVVVFLVTTFTALIRFCDF